MDDQLDTVTFSIAERTYPFFKEEAIGKTFQALSPEDVELVTFGETYKGQFTLRYPTFRDRNRIAAVQMKMLVEDGFDIPDMGVPQNTADQTFAFAAVQVLGIKKPDWFDAASPSSELDTLAVIEVGRTIREVLAVKKKKS